MSQNGTENPNLKRSFIENNIMEDNNQEFDAEFRVRLPSSLVERIAEIAQKERRSRNSQYVYMLENWFELKTKIDDLAGASVNREKTTEKTRVAI